MGLGRRITQLRGGRRGTLVEPPSRSRKAPRTAQTAPRHASLQELSPRTFGGASQAQQVLTPAKPDHRVIGQEEWGFGGMAGQKNAY